MRTSQKYFILIVLFSIFLSACTSSKSSTEPTHTPRPGVTENAPAVKTPTLAVSSLKVKREALRGAQVRVWNPWTGAEASLFEAQVEQFNKTNEWGIVVSAESKSNFSELFLQTDAALKNKTLPDVVIALPEHAIAWRDHVLDLNSYLHDPIYGMSASEMSEFLPVIWTQDEVDDARLGMPAQRTARFLLYNQTWARELGFNSPPRTFSEFEKQACAANQSMSKDLDMKNNALGGWLIDANAMTPLSWMLAFEGGAQEENGYRFLAPGNIDAFKNLKIMQQKSCAWVASDNINVYERFAARQALFATASLEEFVDQSRAFSALGKTDEWTILPFPGKNKTAFVVYGSSFIVFQSDDVTQLASWLFIRWMLSADVQSRWVQSTGLFPLRSSTMSLLADYSASHPQWAQAVKLLPNGQMTPRLASWRNVRIMLGDGFHDMFDTIRHPDLTDGQVPVVLQQMDETAGDLNK